MEGEGGTLVTPSTHPPSVEARWKRLRSMFSKLKIVPSAERGPADLGVRPGVRMADSGRFDVAEAFFCCCCCGSS